MPFDSIIGHEGIRALLRRSLVQERLPPAILLAGPEGVGKRTLALEVGRALLCEQRDGDACGHCRHCSRILRASTDDALAERRAAAAEDPDEAALSNVRLHPDMVLAEPPTTGKRELRVEQVRDLVREIQGRPFEARARAFVVDDAHAMMEQAANALLKILEEPPATSHVLLVTSSPQALLPTIRSRCQLLRMGPLPEPLLEAHLRERVGLSAAEARLRAVLSSGSLGAALAFEADGYRALRDDMLAVLERAAEMGPVERGEQAQRLAEHTDLALALTVVRSLLRDAAALRAGAGPERLLNADVAERLAAVASGPLGGEALALAAAAGRTRTALRGNANKLLSLDVLFDALAS